MTKEQPKSDRAGDLLESLTTVAADVLQSEAGMEDTQARAIGESISYKFATKEGGVSFYLPRGLGAQLVRRNVEIKKKFNGLNYADLASEYGLTEMRVRQILARPKK
jgi:Mor family transcriptional regulator